MPVSPLSFERLSQDPPEDVARMQAVLQAAPAFAMLTEGRRSPTHAGRDALSALPPGKTLADKFAGVLRWQGEDVAACDLIRGHPEPEIAYLGLLVFAERWQGRGLGPQALRRLGGLAADWGCRTMRLGVISTNTRGHAFWRREGFIELYRKEMPGHTGPAIVMERPVAGLV